MAYNSKLMELKIVAQNGFPQFEKPRLLSNWETCVRVTPVRSVEKDIHSKVNCKSTSP